MRTYVRRGRKHPDILCLSVTHGQGMAFTISGHIVAVCSEGVEQAGPFFERPGGPASLFVVDFMGQVNIVEGERSPCMSGRSW